ncbi:Uncharacterised protein [Haemophilus influenzae]|nr:hypothetical protein BVZ81_00967 [Haemophilus influenzae]PRI87801.1 hypothetical protein BV024_01466 [Haemophilus influenzae]PRJ88549.1 hypothetical protein BV164_01370 [Haemophilus influenzae]PRK70986.1 hypothetical protein BV165_00146 [Haemophilus influenzae]PRL85994.1 hypothetical protein BV023_01483 [Haemophilus influenzae]
MIIDLVLDFTASLLRKINRYYLSSALHFIEA